MRLAGLWTEKREGSEELLSEHVTKAKKLARSYESKGRNAQQLKGADATVQKVVARPPAAKCHQACY